jgi:hypothetical protein
MKERSILSAAILILFAFATDGKAQALSDEPVLRPAAAASEGKDISPKTELAAPVRIRENNDAKPLPPVRFHKYQFLILSAAVYGASLTDMHQTLQERKYPWWYETDPLVRPFVRLPGPAYYAGGLAMATGLNWISWKMGHSRRWHRLAAIPQLFAIGGNLYGYKSNLFPMRLEQKAR